MAVLYVCMRGVCGDGNIARWGICACAGVYVREEESFRLILLEDSGHHFSHGVKSVWLCTSLTEV